MTNNKIYVPFFSLFSLGRGLNITKSDYQDVGIPCLSYGDIHSRYKGFIDTSKNELPKVSEKFIIENSSSLLQKGDIVFADTSEDYDGSGDATCVTYIATNLFAGYHTTIARPKDRTKIYSPFYGYYFQTKHFRDQICRKVNGVKVFSITNRILNSTRIPLLRYEDQKRLVDQIQSVDNKIEKSVLKLNNLVKNLDSYRKSLILRAVTKGLKPNIQMRESGVSWIGEMPASWNLGRVKYYITINHGRDPKKEGNIPVYGSGSESFKTCGEYKEGPAVLLGRKGTLNVPRYVSGKFWNVDTAFDAHSKDYSKIDIKFFYYLACNFEYGYYKNQTTLPSMTQFSYENMLIPVPGIKEQKEIVSYIQEEERKICHHTTKFQNQIQKLMEYRKSLISNLLC